MGISAALGGERRGGRKAGPLEPQKAGCSGKVDCEQGMAEPRRGSFRESLRKPGVSGKRA